jgi:hypothetical protein
MTATLFHAYAPLILWTSLGLLIFRVLPQWFPRLLGRGLFWVGIPIELLALARRTNFSAFQDGGNLPLLAPMITFAALVLNSVIAFLVLWGLKRYASRQSKQDLTESLLPDQWLDSSSQGSFMLAAVLGNTGFVGLAIAPAFISVRDLNWAVFYSITHNVIGIYGFGVVIASYFSHSQQQNRWWMQVRDVLTVPSLWASAIGYLTQPIQLPEVIESGLQASVDIVIACAFLLTGIRLAQLQGWKSFRFALLPAVLKVAIAPALIGLATTILLGLSGDRRLAMVLMAGMPSAFAGLILAEEYNLDRDLIASSIALSTLLLLLVLPLWLVVFG